MTDARTYLEEGRDWLFPLGAETRFMRGRWFQAGSQKACTLGGMLLGAGFMTEVQAARLDVTPADLVFTRVHDLVRRDPELLRAIRALALEAGWAETRSNDEYLTDPVQFIVAWTDRTSRRSSEVDLLFSRALKRVIEEDERVSP